jgi:hypothetical protein
LYSATVSSIVGPFVELGVDAARSSGETVVGVVPTDEGFKRGDTALGVEVAAAPALGV